MNDLTGIVIGSIFVGILFTTCGSMIFNLRVPKNFKSLLMFSVLVITVILSRLYLDNAFKVMAIYIVTVWMDRIIFKKSAIQCSSVALISYLILSLGEIFASVLLSIATKFGIFSLHDVTKGDVFINLLISLSAYFILLIIHKKLRKIVIGVKENNKVSYIFAFSIMLLSVYAILYKFFSTGYKFDDIFIVNLFLIVAVCYIGVIMIKQIYDKSKISDEYEHYVEYSKQSEKLVEDYSISQHENKNELIIIRSMVHKSNKKLLEYLDEIISNKDNIENSWIRYLRYIPFGGLKGIIHNKISEMKSDEIKVFLHISNEVEKTKLKDLTMKDNNQLSKIIGVFLDNAREAAMSSSEKEVSINIFVEDEFVIFEITNSYDGEVEVDKIYESKYTSKGKGRGYGLALVKGIIEESNLFINETRIINGYFVQILKVKK